MTDAHWVRAKAWQSIERHFPKIIPPSQSIHSQSRLGGNAAECFSSYSARSKHICGDTRGETNAIKCLAVLRRSAAAPRGEMQWLSVAEASHLFTAFIPTQTDWHQICPWWVLITGFISCTLRMKRTLFLFFFFFLFRWQAWWQIFSPRVNQMRGEGSARSVRMKALSCHLQSRKYKKSMGW